MNTSQKVALITGGTRGLGRAISLRLAKDGFAIAANYVGNAEQADQTIQEINSAGGNAIALQGDIAEPADVARIFEETINEFGRIDVVVNSAGIMPMQPIAGGDPDIFDKVIAVNLKGTYLVMGKAAELLKKGGRIIALSSSVNAHAFPGYGPYIASKAGVEGLVKVLANELRGRGISVNAIAPGPVGTDLFLSGKTEEQIARIGSMASLEARIGTPEEIASAVSFLAGEDGKWVSAQVLRVNGGFA